MGCNNEPLDPKNAEIVDRQELIQFFVIMAFLTGHRFPLLAFSHPLLTNFPLELIFLNALQIPITYIKFQYMYLDNVK